MIIIEEATTQASWLCLDYLQDSNISLMNCKYSKSVEESLPIHQSIDTFDLETPGKRRRVMTSTNCMESL
jgi:hypothetical protein